MPLLLKIAALQSTTQAEPIQSLIQEGSQTRFVAVQVRRNGQWVNVPVDSVQASIGKGKAGSVKLVIGNDDTDPARSQLYEGERIRVYRGVLGAAPVRSWTGFVDTRGATDTQGISRSISVTDNIQELNDAILIDGVFYDNFKPMEACADAIQRAITSQQVKFYDDFDNLQSTTANYGSVGGNGVCYFPDLTNDDGSTFLLPQGTIASFTSGTGQTASFSIPVASGAAYSTFELPKRFLIASTVSMPGFRIASTSNTFPPASGTAILDAYNGILYFNASQASTTVQLSASYYDGANWDFPPGTKVGDVVSQIMDKVGCRWGVDANGKFYATRIDAVRAPARILSKSQYVSNEIEINRDRRNVIVCLGWDGNCGGVLAAKAVNVDDINNAPPAGLGKRAYLVVQDKAWKTQYAVSQAAYYAVQQVGRRGKVMNVNLLDDPTITTPETVLCFEGTIPEIGSGDFFYVEDIQWTYETSGSGFAMMSLAGTLLPGRGLIYLGPINGTTSYGSLDYTQDVQCITNPTLAKPSINLAPNSDSLSGWGQGGGAFSTGGRGGATDWEYTGTGSADGDVFVYYLPISITPGSPYTASFWIDPSQITSGSFLVKIWDTNNNVVAQLTSSGRTVGRYAVTVASPSVTQVKIGVEMAGAVVTSGQKFKVSQPQFENGSAASAYQSSSAITPNAGGSYFSTFSISGGWLLSYTIGSLGGTESVDIYGSDGSHIVGDQNVARAANQTLTLVLPTSSLKPGVMYVVRLWFKDSNGNIGVYRDFITAMA